MKKFLIILLAVGAVAGGYTWYFINKPMSSTDDLKAAYSVHAEQLFSEFERDEPAANAKYLGKIIEVDGTVRDVSIGDGGELNLVMNSGNDMFGINCGLSKGQDAGYKKYQVGDSIRIKGECTGISMDVVMVRCVIVP